MEAVLRERGHMRYGHAGPATVRSVLAAALVETVLDDLERHPEKLPDAFGTWAASCR